MDFMFARDLLGSCRSRASNAGISQRPLTQVIDDIQSAIEPESIKVLIVDDEPCDEYLIRRALKLSDTLDAQITSVFSVDSARLALQMDEFDVVIVDFLVNGECGPELLLEFPGITLATVPILITGMLTCDVAAHAMSLGATACLSKDEITPGLLERTLQQELRHRNIRRRLTEGVLLQSVRQFFQRDDEDDAFSVDEPIKPELALT